MKGHILLAEDDDNLAFIVKDQLEMNGFEVSHAKTGEEAIALFSTEAFHLCLLDVMMPKVDGFKVAEEIRKSNQQVPILFLTAKVMKEDRLLGFKTGGDDYITKPFSMEELLLRMAVFLKRTQVSYMEKEVFCFGHFQFDYRNLTLSSSDGKIELTHKEADILRYFCQRPNTLVKREDLLKHVWGDDDYFVGRSLDVFISKLRKYLQADERVSIRNVHGVGFEFVLIE